MNRLLPFNDCIAPARSDCIWVWPSFRILVVSTGTLLQLVPDHIAPSCYPRCGPSFWTRRDRVSDGDLVIRAIFGRYAVIRAVATYADICY